MYVSVRVSVNVSESVNVSVSVTYRPTQHLRQHGLDNKLLSSRIKLTLTLESLNLTLKLTLTLTLTLAEYCLLWAVGTEDVRLVCPYFVALNDAENELVNCIKGMKSLRAFVCSMSMARKYLEGKFGIHRGVRQASERVLEQIVHVRRRMTKERPSLQIVMVGHSLGAGIAATTAFKLRYEHNFKNVRCIGFACPPIASLNLAQECKSAHSKAIPNT